MRAGWAAVGAALPVALGRAGLAWGRGCTRRSRRTKREGDGCSPAGVFAISALFGDAPDSPLARTAKLPYGYATRDLKCVDDPASAYYNRIVDQAGVVVD